MGQQHRVTVKRRRRAAYVARKKEAVKTAGARSETPKPKARAKKSAAVAAQ